MGLRTQHIISPILSHTVHCVDYLFMMILSTLSVVLALQVHKLQCTSRTSLPCAKATAASAISVTNLRSIDTL